MSANSWLPGISATRDDIQDHSYRLDFGCLHDFLCGTAIPGRAALYGSRPPANDSLWAIARAKGFEVVVFDRNAANREKKVDTQIVTDVLTDSYELMQPGRDTSTIVGGDADYVPPIQRLKARGFRVEAASWDQASRELKGEVNFFSLNPYLDYLGHVT